VANMTIPDKDYLAGAVTAMKRLGVRFTAGLEAEELAAIEKTHSLQIPPDLGALLLYAVPVGDKFPDWRGPIVELETLLSRPLEGLLFDVERNNFWVSSWGPRPADLSKALAIARKAVAGAPKLAPVYMHRYMPAEPDGVGNPVLSVHQTDIIRYANDLPHYLWREFAVPLPPRAWTTPIEVRFWDELIRLNEERVDE
jgi:hypothetical protein